MASRTKLRRAFRAKVRYAKRYPPDFRVPSCIFRAANRLRRHPLQVEAYRRKVRRYLESEMRRRTAGSSRPFAGGTR